MEWIHHSFWMEKQWCIVESCAPDSSLLFPWEQHVPPALRWPVVVAAGALAPASRCRNRMGVSSYPKPLRKQTICEQQFSRVLIVDDKEQRSQRDGKQSSEPSDRPTVHPSMCPGQCVEGPRQSPVDSLSWGPSESGKTKATRVQSTEYQEGKNHKEREVQRSLEHLPQNSCSSLGCAYEETMQGQGKSELRGLGKAVHGTHTGLGVLPANTHNSQHMGRGIQRVLCQQ